jgi:hypothetical protein
MSEYIYEIIMDSDDSEELFDWYKRTHKVNKSTYIGKEVEDDKPE